MYKKFINIWVCLLKKIEFALFAGDIYPAYLQKYYAKMLEGEGMQNFQDDKIMSKPEESHRGKKKFISND